MLDDSAAQDLHPMPLLSAILQQSVCVLCSMTKVKVEVDACVPSDLNSQKTDFVSCQSLFFLNLMVTFLSLTLCVECVVIASFKSESDAIVFFPQVTD